MFLKNKSQIFFRVDVSEKIGFGHGYRCLAIAEMIAKKFSLVFCVSEKMSETFFKQQQYQVHKNNYWGIEEFEKLSHNSRNNTKNNLIIIDGYQFNFDYQRKISSRFKTIVIDDLAENRIHADVVINHGGGILASEYFEKTSGKVFSGLKYALLRKKFLNEAKQEKSFSKNQKILILFGGSDPLDYTKKSVDRLIDNEITNNVEVILGPGYNHKESISFYEKSNISFHRSLNVNQLIQLYKNSACLVCSPSNTAVEAMCVGIPLLILKVAENQKRIEKFILDNQCGVSFVEATKNLNSFKSFQDKRSAMLKNQSIVIDGKSDERIIKILQSLINS